MPSLWNLTPGLAFISACLLVFDAIADDDTFSCISARGPLITLSGERGYSGYRNSRVLNNTKLDARKASWKSEQYPNLKNINPIIVGKGNSSGAGSCWAGGVVLGTNPVSAGYYDLYRKLPNGSRPNGAAITINAIPNFTIDGLRVHNTWDVTHILKGSNPYHGSKGFHVKRVWVTGGRDDCIENDNGFGGIVEDSVLECSASIFSANPGNFSQGQKLVIKNNIMKMHPSRGLKCDGPCLHPGIYGFFKWDSQNKPDGNGPQIELHNNVFFADRPANVSKGNQWWVMGVPVNRLRACSNNIMIWPGYAGYPNYPGNLGQSQFPKCWTFIKDASLYEQAKRNWINCHPRVSRLPGDPKSDPAKCNPNFYGGGGAGPTSVSLTD